MLTVRIRQTTAPLGAENDLVVQMSRTVSVAELQKIICKELNFTEAHQKLYYGGKELLCTQKIADYKLNNNDVIQLMIKDNEDSINKTPDESVGIVNILINATSKYYQTGDPIDVIYRELGAWFEAKIFGIFVDENKKEFDEQDLIFQVVMDREEQTAPISVKFDDIRPRATSVYEKTELKPDMMVFVNYNIRRPRERGYWYDFKIATINKNSMDGRLMLGTQLEDIDNCRIKFLGEVMKIEEAILLSERVNDVKISIPLRQLPLYCKKCKDVPLKDCKACSCTICGRKNFIDKLIICDECGDTYHLFCLNPPLQEVPLEPEWYCPDCKTDENEIVKAGEMPKTLPHTHYTHYNALESSIIQKKFGPIFGISVGTCWNYRSQVFESGVHGTLSSDIDSEDEGVYSIILDREHEIYLDDGDELYYSISDRNRGSKRKKISVDLSLQHSTQIIKRLTLNCYNSKTNNSGFGKADLWTRSKPIRLIRSSNIRFPSKFAPDVGYRYDGIYKIVEYFPAVDAAGTIVWRFLMKRHDPACPPWIRRDEKSNTDGCEDPENPIKTIFHLDERIMTFIKDDLVNEKLWNECKIMITQGKQKFVDKVKELFTCACCQDIAYMPVTTNCKHNICFECLKNCFIADIYRCPNCRLVLDRKILIQINRNLDSALKLIFAGYTRH